MARHQHVSEMRKPVRQPEPPEAYRVAMRSERIGARAETTIAVTIGSITICQSRLTSIDISPNDNALVARPDLDLVKISGSTVITTGG